MTAREVLKDFAPLARFTREQLIAWGYPSKPALDLATVEGGRQRYLVLEKDGAILAATYIFPFKTDKGPGYEIKLFLVRFDFDNRLLASDALSLWGLNLMLSEDVHFLYSNTDTSKGLPTYGKDFAGATTEQSGDLMKESVDPATTIEIIFNRRPSWRTSLSSMT